MRQTDGELHPKAVERKEAELRETRERVLAGRAGLGLMGFAALLVGAPILRTGDISVVAAVTGLAIGILGGLVRDPKTDFGAIAIRAIDALPGGRN